MVNKRFFSSTHLWEIAIQRGLDRDQLQVDICLLRRERRDNGYIKRPITSGHQHPATYP